MNYTQPQGAKKYGRHISSQTLNLALGLSCDHRFSRFSHGLRSTLGCGAHRTNNTTCEKED